MAFTYFFRDLQTLEMFCDYALPDLKTKSYIDIWDAGCATGAEVYTLAMLLRERMGRMYFRNVRIKATDIDESNIFGELIQKGIYPWEQLERIPEDIFKKYFVSSESTNHYQVSEEIRKQITYQRHDLTSLNPIGRGFGMILCKNVLLHLTERQRIDVIKMFYDSLMDGGYFVTEQTQKLPDEVKGLFEQVVNNAQLFRKITQ